MATCPNRNLQSWKDLESLQGESLAMVIWDRFEGRPPEFFYTTKLEEGTIISKGFDIQTRFTEEQNNAILDSIIYMLMERKKQEDFNIGDHIGNKSTRGAIPNFFLQQAYETEDGTSPSLEVAERVWKKEQAYEKSVRESASQEEQDRLYDEWVSLMEEEGIYEIDHPGREAFLDIYEFWNGGIITSGKTEQEIKADVALGNTDVVGWRELLANRMKLFGYSISNIEQETEFATDEDILERIYSKSSMEEDPSKKLTGRMKELLATIPNKDINFLGFQTYLPVDQVYKELSSSFAGLQNFPEMLAQVETLALHKPQYSAVADFMMRLNKKDAATFSRVFAQSANEFLLIRVEAKTPAGDVVRLFNPNENRIERSIATTWKNGAVESNIAKPKAIYKVTEAGLEIDQTKAKKIAESWLGVRRGIAGADNVLSPQGEVSVPVQALTELLWNMGIYLGDPEIKEETANNLQQIVNTGIFVVDNGRRQKLVGRAAYNYIANREGKSLARLVSQFVVLSPDGTKVERTIKSVGSTVFESQGSTVRHIASFAPLFFDMRGDSFVNGKGKQIYPINLRHHLGQIFEVLGSATEDKTEMMDMYGSDRFFKPVDGRPEFDSLLYRLLQSDEYTQEFKAIDLDALKDVTIPDGTVDYENFSNSDSLRTRLIAYINSGNRSVGLVAIPVQSDRKKFTFFPFVRTKNLAGTRGGTYGITGMTKNDIILGMIAQDMMRIAHGRGILSNQVTEEGLPNPPKDLPLTYIKNLQSPQAMQFDGTLVGSEGNIPIVTDAKLESKTGEYFISDFIEEYLTTPEELKEIEPEVFNEIQTKLNIMVERTNEYFLDQAKKLNEKITTQSITLPVEAREFGDRMTLLENYVFDEFMGRNEISKILRGSRAHVKDIQTFYKRIGHGTTPGMELALASDLNINGLEDVDGIANYGMPDTFIEATFEDIRLNLNQEMRDRAIERANAIRDGLIEAGYDAEFAELLAEEYYPDEVEGTDAQGLISIDFYRDLMQGKGEWFINEEKAYDAYKAAPTGSKQFVYQEGFVPQGFKVGDAVPVYPQKPYYERNELVGGVVTTDSHKNSYHLLLEGETKNNPVKDNLRRRMEAVGEYSGLQRIGVANFVTAKKIKVNKVNTLTETTGALSNVEFNTVNSKGLRFPQEIPKKKASTTMFNRQVRKNTISNINSLHTYTLNAGLDTEIKISGQEMLDMYHAAIERKIKLEFAKVEKELGIDKIQKALAKQDVAAYNQSMIDFHKKLRDKLKDNNIERDLPTNYDAGLKIELDPAGRPQFKVPLDFPVYFEKYQRVILGMAINEAFKQKVPGMEAVQVAEIGGYAESGELEFLKIEKDKSGTARVVHMEVMIREDIARKFGLEPGQDLSTLPEELRRIIGYRIPNQGKSSTVIMKIKRILPANYAKAVIVPAQLTKLTGSDFDIDKMFLMFPEVRMTDAGPVKIRPPYEALLGIPTTQSEIKPGVEELFESNPELANAVYEALGFNQPTYTKQSLIDKYGEKGKEIFDTLQSISWNLGPERYKVSSLSTDKILSLINYREEYNDVLKTLEKNLKNLFSDIIKRKNINKELNDILDEFGDDVYETLKEKLDDRKKERGESIYGEEKFLKGNLLTTLKSLEEFGFPSDKFNSLLKDAVEFTKTSKKGELNKSLEELYDLLDSFKSLGEYESIDLVDYYTKKLESEEGIIPQQKQQAQQLYSQYLDSLNKPNTNPILQGNQQEQIKKFAELQERLNNKEFLEGAKSAYESTPALQQLGTQEEYNDYIARVSLGIIKNPSSGEYNYTSQVKDIVYHGANEPIEGERFIKRAGATGRGIWFSGSRKYAQIQMDKAQPSESLIGRKLRGAPTMYQVVLNIKNPKHFYDATGALLVQTPREFEKQYDRTVNDAALFHHPNSKKPVTADSADQVVVFEPEQIHILGGKNDIEGFKEFAASPKSTTTETSIDKITDVSILNNIILDIVEAVQANLLHVNESMAPLDESTLPKLVADIEAKFPELQAPLEFASAEIETEMGIRNTIGRAMRGLWANFIAGHAVAAYGDITVNPMYELTLDGRPYSQLIGIAGQEVESFDKGVPVNMIGSRYLSAAVDAAKKPYQYTLNDRTFTYPVESYWIAFSGDTKALHDFLNVPIIRAFTDNFYTKYGAKPILMENALLDVIPQMYKDSLKQDRLRPSTPMSREELSDPFNLTPERQYELLLNFLKFREAGRSLSQMFKVIAPDSMDGMNSIDSIKSYRSRQNQFNPSITGEENQIFVNSNDPNSPVVDQFIGDNSVYGMQRGFSNLFLDIADMASKIFPMTVSPALDNLDTKIMDLTGNTQLNPEAHREIRRAAMLSLFASEGSPLREFFSESHLQSNYLNRESNLVTKLRDMKVKHPKLAQNLFIRKFVENNDNDLLETKVYLLDFDTSYQMTRFEKDAVTLAAYRLLKRPEEIVGKDASIEDRQSIINLAEDLLMNTLIVHGFKQTTGSYQDLIPVTFFTENRYARYNNPGERLGTAVDFFRKQLTAMYITDTFDNFAADFIRQNYTQSPGGYTLVQGIRKKETPNELVLNDKDKIRMYKNGYPIPFITITNSITNETFLYASGHILTSGSVQGKYVKVNPLGVDGKLIEATNPDKSVINTQGFPLSSITMTSISTGMTTNTGNIAATKEQQDIICR